LAQTRKHYHFQDERNKHCVLISWMVEMYEKWFIAHTVRYATGIGLVMLVIANVRFISVPV
jgi:hypothetical protein